MSMVGLVRGEFDFLASMSPRPSQNNVINQFINQFQSMLLPVLFLTPLGPVCNDMEAPT